MLRCCESLRLELIWLVNQLRIFHCWVQMMRNPKKHLSLDSGEEYVNCESANSGHPPSRNADEFPCLVMVDGRDFQELPVSWRNFFKRPKRGRWIIFLQGLDKRIWPVFYRTRPGFDDVLTSGWEQVTAAYDLNAEDFCLFELINRQEHIFGVRKLC